MEFDLSIMLTSAGLISLLTLTLMEIVLGIDNLVFISIVTNKLPVEQQKKGQFIGLSLALLFRVVLLSLVSWIIKLDQSLITVFENEISAKDLILLSGGLFLLYKSTIEIHGKVTGEELHSAKTAGITTLGSAIVQIIILDLIFSVDSIITAVGLVEHLSIMVTAVVVSMIVMIVFVDNISKFINANPTVKMLALSFLLMIGLLLVAEAFDVHVPKGYVYFAMAFSLFVEMLNLRTRRKSNSV